jgi:ribosomal protein L16 Arg81 hydroxylase
MSDVEPETIETDIARIVASNAKLVKALWLALGIVTSSAFTAGVSITNMMNRIANLETYGSMSLRDHEQRQAVTDSATIQALAELKAEVRIIGDEVRRLRAK